MCCGNVLADTAIAGVSADDPCRHVELDPTPSAARAARVFLSEHATELPPEANEVALLCTSELVTNGVLHARTPLVVGVTLGSDRLLVTVADSAPGQPAPKPRDDERTSGRGIVLVDALADEWGVHEDEGGKTVWFTVSRRAS